MRPHRRARRTVVAGLTVLAAGGLAATGTATSTGSPHPAVSAAEPGHLVPAYDALPQQLRAARFPSRPTADECSGFGVDCLDPAGLRAFYDVDALHAKGITGKGITIAIIDSFGSPTIVKDLKAYDAHFGLPDPQIEVIAPAGQPPPFDAGSSMAGWAGETTLDVEVAHVIAPAAKILVVATPTDETEGIAGFPEIIKAERYVIDHHLAQVISQSFGATEATFDSPGQLRSLSQQMYPQALAAGVTVVSASGDLGPTDYQLDAKHVYRHRANSWPSSDVLVTSVGGTEVVFDSAGNPTGEKVWGGDAGGGAAGGGLSDVFGRPDFQNGVSSVVDGHRGTPDVAVDASPQSGVVLYESYEGSGSFTLGGGTSQATPLFAGLVALADQQAGRSIGFLNDLLYGPLAKNPTAAGLRDVTQGTNDLVAETTPDGSVSVTGYPARPGYDLASGLGSIDGAKFVPALAAAAVARGPAKAPKEVGVAPSASPTDPPTTEPPSTEPPTTEPPSTTQPPPPSPRPSTTQPGLAAKSSSSNTPLIAGISAGALLLAGAVLLLVLHPWRRPATAGPPPPPGGPPPPPLPPPNAPLPPYRPGPPVPDDTPWRAPGA